MLVKGRSGAVGRFQIIQFMLAAFWRRSEAAEKQPSRFGTASEDRVDGAPADRRADCVAFVVFQMQGVTDLMLAC